MPRPQALDAWAAARLDLEVVLSQRLDFRAAAAAHIARWPKHPPDFFRFSSQTRRYRVRRAFADGDGWVCRLLSSVQTLGHFSLHAERLGLPRSAAAPHLLFDAATVAKWKRAILSHFRGPCRWRLAVGDGGRIHAHVLADLSDGPTNLPRGGELAKPCESYLEAAVAYQVRPCLEYTVAGLAIWLEHRAGGRRSPQLSGVSGIPSSLRKLHPNSADRSAPPTSTAAPSPNAPVPAPPPQLPALTAPTAPADGLRRRPRPGSARRRLSEPLSPSQSFGPGFGLPSVATAPPAPPEDTAGVQSDRVRPFRSASTARGPPQSATADPQPLDLHRTESPMTAEQQLETELDHQVTLCRRQIFDVPFSHRRYASLAREQLERLTRPGLDLDLRDRLEAVRRVRLELSENLRYGTSSAVLPPAPRPE